LQPLAASVEPVAFSDHNAIWVRLRLDQTSGLGDSNAHGCAHKSNPEANMVGNS
jgi:hypothetical protein